MKNCITFHQDFAIVKIIDQPIRYEMMQLLGELVLQCPSMKFMLFRSPALLLPRIRLTVTLRHLPQQTTGTCPNLPSTSSNPTVSPTLQLPLLTQ